MSSAAVHQRAVFSRYALLAVAVGLSILFVLLIQDFLLTLLLAAIFAGMAHPLHARILKRFHGRRALAAVSTLGVVLCVLVVPMSGFMGIVAAQAAHVIRSAGPWLEDQVGRSEDPIGHILDRLPFSERLAPYRVQVETKVAEMAATAGRWVVDRVAGVTRRTATFLLHLFVLLYAMYFFLLDGREVLRRILFYIPLTPDAEQRLVNHFASVARATIKGTLVIGLIQGTLCGIAFFIAGISGAAFWGVVMVVLSVIPGIGGALVWVPAAVSLAVAGRIVPAVLLTAWCAIVVGSVDNVLRPGLVGRDAKMSDLMILVSTLGGIFLFGAVGFIIGPIIAALFVTVWDIYGTVFKDVLPENA